MKLTARSVTDLLAEFRSSQPTPGGGSAAALAGAVGASLLAMVAGLPKPRASGEDVRRLADAGSRCTHLALQLERLIDQDSEAYDLVVSAFRMPRGTDEEKAARTIGIQRALTAATDAPLDVMRRTAEALGLASVVGELGNSNAVSDVRVAVGLLEAGLLGAQQNVEINLGSLKDEMYVDRARAEARDLASAAVRKA